MATSRFGPRFLSPFLSLPTALAQKLSPGEEAKKPELAAGPPHTPPPMALQPFPCLETGVCWVTSASALMEDSWGPSY